MRFVSTALVGLLVSAFSVACSSGEGSPFGEARGGLETEPIIDPGISVEVPFSERVHLTRTEGEASDSPWAKIERPEPGVIVFDGTEGHPLIDVPDAGITIQSNDDLVAYMVEHFNARKVEGADGQASFSLTIVTVGEVGYAENVNLESMDFVKVSNPVLALLGGKEGVIHLQDQPPIPVQFSYGANCVLGQIDQGIVLPFRQCSAFMPDAISIPGFFRMFGTSAFTSVTEPPSPEQGNQYVGSGCSGGSGPGYCVPQFGQRPPSGPNDAFAPILWTDSRVTGEKGPSQERRQKRSYGLKIATFGSYGDFGRIVGSCARHRISGNREKFDTITYPGLFDRSAAKICLEPEF